MSDYDENYAENYAENLSYIYDTLSDDDLKLQIVDEASELIQAICKLRRATNGTNPTPVSIMDAQKAVYEEIADTFVAIDAALDTSEKVVVASIQLIKAERWAQRIREARNDEA